MRHPQSLLLVAAVALLLNACSQQTPSPDRVYALGEEVEVGHLTYIVYEGQWLPQIGQGTDARIPQHRYFELHLSAANTGSADALVSNATLEDDAGHTYDELANGDGVPTWLGFVRRARAGETLRGTILYDVPPQHYKLHVTDENGDGGARIDIPLSFTTSPETPAPGLGSPDLPKK
jgi:hypothetical protein